MYASHEEKYDFYGNSGINIKMINTNEAKIKIKIQKGRKTISYIYICTRFQKHYHFRNIYHIYVYVFSAPVILFCQHQKRHVYVWKKTFKVMGTSRGWCNLNLCQPCFKSFFDINIYIPKIVMFLKQVYIYIYSQK